MKKPILRTAIIALACVAVAASTFVSAQPALAKSSEEVGDKCADVTLLGVRSSVNEENGFALAINPDARSYMSEDAAPKDVFGLGNSYSANELAKILPDGTTYKKVPILYDSYSMTGIYDEASLSAFRDSVEQAKAATISTAESTLKKCPDTKIVIIGTGHGAQIAHEAVLSLPTTVVDRLAGVWLIGDPIANANDSNQKRYAGGEALPTRSGARLEILSQVPNDPTVPLRKKQAPEVTAFPKSVTGKVISICSARDIFCAASTGITDFNAAAYYMSSSYSDLPARFIADNVEKLQKLPTAVPTPAIAKCADVIFVAARGSGEDENAGQPLQNSSKENYMKGYGDTIATMAYQVKSLMAPSTTTSMQYVQYQALSVDDAMNPLPSRYPRSVNTGIYGGDAFNNSPARVYEGGIKSLKKIMADCPSSKFITMGYSQGAHAMHEIMMHLDESEVSRISASILIADAIRNINDSKSLAFFGSGASVASKDTVIYQGNGVMRVAANADQVCVDLTKSLTQPSSLFGSVYKTVIVMPAVAQCDNYFPKDVRFTDVTTPKPFADALNKKILNVCSVDDLVCNIKQPDKTDVASFVYAVLPIISGKIPKSCDQVLSAYVNQICYEAQHVDEVHGNGYKTNPNFYNFPGKWAAEKLMS